MKIRLKAQYPLGDGIAIYKVENPLAAHQLLKRLGLWEAFKADLRDFSDVADQLPSFLALYPRPSVFVIVHFRVLWNDENPGWALFIAYDDDKEALAEKFANATFDRVSAELVAEPDVHIHIMREIERKCKKLNWTANGSRT